MFTWLFWLMVVLAVLEWLAAWQHWKKVRWVSKPGVLILLIAWFTQIGGWQGTLIWFGIGLIFSLLGDIFLNMSSPRSFIPGVGAFFLAHVAYIIGFWLTPFNWQAKPFSLRWEIVLPILLIGGIYWLFTRRIRAGLRQHAETSMTVPVMMYAGILSLMWLSALSTLLRPGWLLSPAALVSIGAGLFFFSDSVLAYNRFVRPVRAVDLLVMISYHLAQFLIILGALNQLIPALT